MVGCSSFYKVFTHSWYYDTSTNFFRTFFWHGNYSHITIFALLLFYVLILSVLVFLGVHIVHLLLSYDRTLQYFSPSVFPSGLMFYLYMGCHFRLSFSPFFIYYEFMLSYRPFHYSCSKYCYLSFLVYLSSCSVSFVCLFYSPNHLIRRSEERRVR